MKTFVLTAAVCCAAPALAITVNGGSVATGTRVTLGAVADEDTDSDAAIGLPVSLSAASASGATPATAYSTAGAVWTSATAGTVQLNWGWSSQTFSGTPTRLETNLVANGWTYDFTTSRTAARFAMDWVLDLNGANPIGIQGLYGSGGLPLYISPENAEPIDRAGSLSIILAPNTAYSLGLFNFGNLYGPGGLNFTSSATANINWTIMVLNGVPEPENWALLIAGFGLVGTAVRRRRHIAALSSAS